MKTLESERLILRDWNYNDLNDLYEYASDETTGPMAGWSPHKNLEESKEVIKMFIETSNYAIVCKENNKVIGSIGYVKIDEETAVIGYALSKAYWGRGLMTETVTAYVDYLFNDLGFKKITAGHFETNIQSKKVLEKTGFKFKGIGEYFNRHENKILKQYNYELTQN